MECALTVAPFLLQKYRSRLLHVSRGGLAPTMTISCFFFHNALPSLVHEIVYSLIIRVTNNWSILKLSISTTSNLNPP